MKDCKKCEFFGELPYGEGVCNFEGGFDSCPYNGEMQEAKDDEQKQPIGITLDTSQLAEYIKNTVTNTVNTMLKQTIQVRVIALVDEVCKDKVQELTKAAMERELAEHVKAYFDGDITIGGGWRDPVRTLKRGEYLDELVQEELDKRLKDKSAVTEEVRRFAQKRIDDFLKSAKTEINNGVKNYFDAATRQVLTASVVDMLMDNETYKRLSDSMNNLLPDGK